jgi:hypothetical protein
VTSPPILMSEPSNLHQHSLELLVAGDDEAHNL